MYKMLKVYFIAGTFKLLFNSVQKLNYDCLYDFQGLSKPHKTALL